MSMETPTPQGASRRERTVTAGLSAVGATAGAAGLGYAGYKTGQAYRAARRGTNAALGMTRRKAVGAAIKHEKFGAALVPLEIAGLGGELMATKILHEDTKRQPVAKRGMNCGDGAQHGKRIRERPPAAGGEGEEKVGRQVSKGLLTSVPKAAKAARPSNELAAIKHRALGSLSSALENKGSIIQPVHKLAGKPKPKGEERTSGGIAHMGVDGTFLGQQASGHLERAKIHRDRGNQLFMEAIEEESALKRRQADAHLRQAALLEHNAKQKVTGAVGAMGLKEGLGSAGMKGGGGDDGKVKKASKTQADRAQRRRRRPPSTQGEPGIGVRKASLNPLKVMRRVKASQYENAYRTALHGGRGTSSFGASNRAGKLAGSNERARRSYQEQMIGKPPPPSWYGKARRFDPEADRQRRLGAYTGLAGGAGIVTGEFARRQYQLARLAGSSENKILHHAIGFKPGRTKAGLGLTAATAGLAGLGAAAYRRGVSARNQPWS
jgi:hypothetical protein